MNLRPIRIAPSILSADFTRLGDDVDRALAAGAEYIHIDVMDGAFVPNLTIGPLVVEALRPQAANAGALLDVHLMIEKPERMIPAFIQAGAGSITVHVETCPHVHRTIQTIHEMGARAAVTLNPATPLIMLEEIIADVEMVLLMSVNPGFGGQRFIPFSLERTRRLRAMLDLRGLEHVDIEIDGGIDAQTAGAVVAAGANILVAGTAVFKHPEGIEAGIRFLRSAAENARS